MVCLYVDDNIEIYSMLDDQKLPLIYHYEVHADNMGKVTHIDIRNLRAYYEIRPSIFDLISKNKAVISQVIKRAIINNEIDFRKEHQ